MICCTGPGWVGSGMAGVCGAGAGLTWLVPCPAFPPVGWFGRDGWVGEVGRDGALRAVGLSGIPPSGLVGARTSSSAVVEVEEGADDAGARPAASRRGAATAGVRATSVGVAVWLRAGWPVASSTGGMAGPRPSCPIDPSPEKPTLAANTTAAVSSNAGASAVAPAARAACRRQSRTSSTPRW